MINNIAVQFAHLAPDRAAEEIANHVGKFWDPRMKARLVALAAEGPDMLEPTAFAAVALVRGDARSGAASPITDDLLAVRTADGWIEVDATTPQALLGLRNALGVTGGVDLRAAIEKVTTHWTTADALLALDQEDVRARPAQGDHGLVAP